MNDAEFLELLNLYLDHEISAADAARLEAEVQRTPARRELYRQYCRMQKACSMLAADFAAEPDTRKIVEFKPARQSWQPAVWGLGALAAAACVAFVAFNRSAQITPVSEPVVASYTVPVVSEPVTPPPADSADTRAIARTIGTPVRRNDLQPVLLGNALALDGGSGTVAIAPAQFDWMRNVKLTPMQPGPVVDELLRFDQRPSLKPETPVYRSRRPIQGNVEMTAFQFQK